MKTKGILAFCGIFMIAAADVATAQEASDWSGLYAGFTAGTAVTGETVFFDSGISADRYDAEGDGAGFFVGYNLQRDAFVYGMELAAQRTDYGAYDPGGSSSFSSIIDVKLRGGVATGKVLPYAFLGYSSGDWDNFGSVTNPRADGMNYGVGVDYQFSAQMFGGLEYIYRETETSFDLTDNSVKPEFGALQFRLGMRF